MDDSPWPWTVERGRLEADSAKAGSGATGRAIRAYIYWQMSAVICLESTNMKCHVEWIRPWAPARLLLPISGVCDIL